MVIINFILDWGKPNQDKYVFYKILQIISLLSMTKEIKGAEHKRERHNIDKDDSLHLLQSSILVPILYFPPPVKTLAFFSYIILYLTPISKVG